MSYWTYINGTIVVDSVGNTQAQNRYILETILSHLPLVTGSEHNMKAYLIQPEGTNYCSNVNEFGQFVEGGLEKQDTYIIVVHGDLRDREFKETFTEFNKWICRLAKRADIRDVLVKLSSYDKEYIFTNKNEVYSDMYELPSWANNTGEPAWWEYLDWKADKFGFPRVLAYKYFNDKENDKQVQNWIK